MPVLLEKDVKAVSIEYLPTEREQDKTRPLEVGQGLLDNIRITEELTSIDFYGTKRYKTGLDAEIVKSDPSLDATAKDIKVKQIEETVKRLEKYFGQGKLDATNSSFWSEVKLRIDKKTVNLDLTDPRKEVLYHCIKAGGFSTVAPSYEEALGSQKKFYLIEPVEFIENRVSPRKLLNEAVETLQKLDKSKTFDDLFYITKYLVPVERGYTKKTPKNLMYEDLDKWIKGELEPSRSKSTLARLFLEATKLPKDYLVVYNIVKDALYYGMLYTNNAGEFKNNETGGIYGNSIDAAVKHLLSPGYVHELDNIKDRVVQKWSE